MLFNSLKFLIFLPVILILYFILPEKIKNLWLLGASYYFYMCWNVEYALLILFSTVITYISGRILEGLKNDTCFGSGRKIWNKRKLVVFVSFSLNLFVLFYFKYFNFAIDILQNVAGSMHIQLNLPEYDILLPVGISFYTFQALGYILDVYRNDIYAERSFIKYALFVSFFPQLVAGPIERSKNLLKQLAGFHKFDFDRVKEGLLLMLWGYFLKLVISDRIAIFVDTIYGDYMTYGGAYLIIATVFFAVQIYCDFAGYSVIAMGVAKMLGINLMDNFDAPYLSMSVAEFWRKWHISLTSWFKDYLYIPLGGSHKGKIRKYINKLAVFLVSGLWHGASFSFVAWGGVNGLYQVIGEVLKPARDKIVGKCGLNREAFTHKLLHVAGTFILVDFSWIFFRASRFREAFIIIRQMFSVYNPWVMFDGSIYNCGLNSKNFWLLLVCLLVLLFADCCKYRKIQVREIIMHQDSWFQVVFISFSILAVLVFGIYGSGYNQSAFIYFQF